VVGRRLSVAVVIGVLGAGPATAGEVATAAATARHHDRQVSERIAVDTVVRIAADPALIVSGAALAQASATAAEEAAVYRGVGHGVGGVALARDAIRGGGGIATVNQAAGALANQGNVVALGDNAAPSVRTRTETTAAQTANAPDLRETAGGSARTAIAEASFAGRRGITLGNQAAGVAAAQHHLVATGFGVDRVALRADNLTLQAINAAIVETRHSRRRSNAFGILNGNEGIAGFNQSTGFATHQAANFAWPMAVPVGLTTAINNSGLLGAVGC